MPSRRTTLGVSTIHNVRYSSIGDEKLKRTVRRGKDPRDLHDKAFQKQAAGGVIAFLAEKRYPHEISAKTLSKQKDFFSAVWFILGTINPELADLPAAEKTTDALVNQLKRLMYPYVPPKSTLQAFSASIYWPAMLGMLDWLVIRATMVTANDKHKADLLTQGSWVGNAPIALLVTGDTGHIEDQQKESERIELFAAGYRAYMSGDERAEVFANLLHKRRAPLVGSEESRNTRLRKERDVLVSKRDALMQEPDTVSEALGKLEKVRKGQDALRDSISVMKEHLSASKKKYADSEARCRQVQMEIEQDEREQDYVKSQIEAQPIKVKELQGLRKDVKMASRVQCNKLVLLEEAKQALEDARLEHVDAIGRLEHMLLKYNRLLAKAQMHPTYHSAADDHDYEAKLMSGIDSSAKLSVDMKTVQAGVQCWLQYHLERCKRDEKTLRTRQRGFKFAQDTLKDVETMMLQQQEQEKEALDAHETAKSKLQVQLEQRKAGCFRKEDPAHCMHTMAGVQKEDKHREQQTEELARDVSRQKEAWERQVAHDVHLDQEAAQDECEALNKLANSLIPWSNRWIDFTLDVHSKAEKMSERARGRVDSA